MTQGGKEMMAGRWLERLERLHARDALDQIYFKRFLVRLVIRRVNPP